MIIEYLMLFIMTILITISWLPASYGASLSYGKEKWLKSNRQVPTNKVLLPWAGRAQRAYRNMQDFYMPFAITILLLGLLNGFTKLTGILAIVFTIARICHFISYLYGKVSARSLAWFVALLAQFGLSGRLLWLII